MIEDRQLSLTVLLAWALWAMVIAGLVLAFLTDEAEWAYVGLASSAGAATLHMRSFMCVFSSRLKGAFELGRQVEREQHQGGERDRDLFSV